MKAKGDLIKSIGAAISGAGKGNGGTSFFQTINMISNYGIVFPNYEHEVKPCTVYTVHDLKIGDVLNLCVNKYE